MNRFALQLTVSGHNYLLQLSVVYTTCAYSATLARYQQLSTCTKKVNTRRFTYCIDTFAVKEVLVFLSESFAVDSNFIFYSPKPFILAHSNFLVTVSITTNAFFCFLSCDNFSPMTLFRHRFIDGILTLTCIWMLLHLIHLYLFTSIYARLRSHHSRLYWHKKWGYRTLIYSKNASLQCK